MKKITQNLRWLVTLLTMIVSVGAWAETSTVSASKVTSSSASWTGSANETWTVTVNGGATNQNVTNEFAQIGTKNSPSTSITFSTSGISETITKIEVECASYNGLGTVSATVGSEAFGIQGQSIPSWADNGGTVTFSGSASGEIVITMTNGTGGRAMYIKSITVTYSNSGETPTPSITVDPATVNATAEETDGTLAISYDNLDISSTTSFGIQYYNASNEEIDKPDWIVVEVESEEAGVSYMISYVIDANEGEARTANCKVYAMGDEDFIYSNLITINQAEYVAPSIASLPFTYNGGRDGIEETDGLTQEGLDSDYASSPKLKFKEAGSWVLLQFDEAPGDLSFDIKGYSFSGGTFTVQTSTDGVTYNDLKNYTVSNLGTSTQTETFNNLSSDVRYIKWIYTTKSSGNVGLGNIKLEKRVPQIIVDNTTIDVDANKNDGIVEVTYKYIDPEFAEIHFYAEDGETSATYDWIDAEFDGDNNIEYHISANEGAARTAYLKVYGLDAEANDIYSDLITINQAAAPQSYTLTITPNDNADFFVFYNDANYTPIASTLEGILSNDVTSNSEVLISVDVQGGYEIDDISVLDENNDPVELTAEDDGISWTFIMPESDVTVSCTVKEVEPHEELTFVKVTSTDELVAGGEYIIIAHYPEDSEGYYAMTTTQNNNNRGADGISVSEDIAYIEPEHVQVITLEGDSEGWYFNTGDGYLYAAASNYNYLRTETTPDENGNAKATIGISSDGDATIVFKGNNSRNNLRFNNNNILFSCYASSSELPLVQLYKKVVEEEIISIGSAGYATYVTKNAVQFNDVKAYAVLAVGETSVALEPLTKAPANTPIIVEGTAGEHPCTIIESAEGPTVNCLSVSNGTVTGDGTTIYALANKEQGVGFYPVGNGITIPAGKAYLDTSSAKHHVKGFLALGGVADAINNIAVETANGTIFNIAGQKVQNITKSGLYIVNGKKVVVK